LNPLLRVDGLSVGRGDRVLLTDFALSLDAGVLLHLRGRNGAGKTSLLEVLAGLRAPLRGQVVRPEAGLHWLGHKNGLNGDLSLIENLQYWCALQQCSAAPIVTSLERLGLARLRYRAARTLSAGQKRRAALARLLIAPRPLWLLDEPLAALDVAGLDDMGRMFDQHLQQGGAVIVTSHQPLPLADGRMRTMELS